MRMCHFSKADLEALPAALLLIAETFTLERRVVRLAGSGWQVRLGWKVYRP
jgi:hypothetical protein